MHAVEKAVTKMGARLKWEVTPPSGDANTRWMFQEYSVNVRRDEHGEFFVITRFSDATTEFDVLDVQPRDRHLLLLTRKGKEKRRFLLGHDERHWFVCGIPEKTPVTRVRDAIQALKPDSIIEREHGIRVRERNRRSNHARTRQGEWFFVPVPEARVNKRLILRKEPLQRFPRSKPHMCDELFRQGGETVYVDFAADQALTQSEYNRLTSEQRARGTWRVMKRNPRVLVRGAVRHPDHKTVFLDEWHEVFINTEEEARAARNVGFLD